jgi:hypothetical protein
VNSCEGFFSKTTSLRVRRESSEENPSQPFTVHPHSPGALEIYQSARTVSLFAGYIVLEIQTVRPRRAGG